MITLLGKAHILLLHLPIGILLLAIVFEWAKHLKWMDIPSHMLSFTYGAGMISALLACITGYTLSVNDGLSDPLVSWHQWSGVATFIYALFMFLHSRFKLSAYQRWLSLILLTLVIITGHLGGSITHGEDFLNPFSLGGSDGVTSGFSIDNIEEAEIYEDVIQVIFNNKCVACHGPKKVKGKFRMDNKEFLLAGGKSGKSIIHSGSEQSELVRRITLPLSEEDHMPPKRKPQLTDEEIILVQWWIDSGAAFGQKVGNADTLASLVRSVISAQREVLNRNEELVIPAQLPEVMLPLPPEEVIQALGQSNIVVLPAGEDSPFLEINFVNVDNVTLLDLDNLKLLAPHIIRLKWSDLNVGNIELEALSEMENLMRLYLDGTQISDEGMSKLAGLKNLEYLNINNTGITDIGLQGIVGLKNLKVIYAYNTSVSMNNALEDIEIIRGDYKLEVLATDTLRIAQ